MTLGASIQSGEHMSRLMFITTRLLNDGVHQHVEVPTIRYLNKVGFDVTVIAPKIDGRIPLEDEVEIHWVNWKRLPLMETMSRLRGIKKELQKLLSVATFNAGIVDIMAATTLMGVMKQHDEFPFIIDERSPPVYDHLAGRLQWIPTDRQWKKAAPSAAACVVQSEAHVEFIQERYGLKNLNFVVFRNSVDPSRFDPGGKESEPIAVYAGTLRKERGIRNLVAAAHQINLDGIPLQVKFFGQGPMEKWLKKQSSEHTWFLFLIFS